MENSKRWLVVLFMVLYILSPVDGCPGPVDDAIVLLIGLSLCRRSGSGHDLTEQ